MKKIIILVALLFLTACGCGNNYKKVTVDGVVYYAEHFYNVSEASVDFRELNTERRLNLTGNVIIIEPIPEKKDYDD